MLETRVLLTEFAVTKAGYLSDGNVGEGEVTYPEAVVLANNNPGPDSIVFRNSSALFQSRDPLPQITDDVTINAGGKFMSFISIDGPAFDIAIGVTVRIENLAVQGTITSAGKLSLNSLSAHGIENSGELTIEHSFLTGSDAVGNEEPSVDGRGGALYSKSGSVTVHNSTISDSFGELAGGGVFIESGIGLIINSTIVNNRSRTFSGLQPGGGLFINSGADVTLHNTIVAGNAGAPSDIAGMLNPASSFNIIGDADAAGGLVDGMNGNIVGNGGVGVIPLSSILDPDLKDNGGATLTHALVAESPALNSGSIAVAKDADGNTLTTDQRGFRRVFGNGIDRGAFELQLLPNEIANDVASFNTSTGIWQIGLSNGDDFSDTRGPRWSTAVTWETFTGDVNHDGLTDLIGRQRENGNWWVAVNQGNGTFQTQSFLKWAPDAAANWQNVQVADVNGDGRDDIIGMTNGNWWGAISNGTRFVNQYLGKWQAAGWQAILSGDLNGDGNDDVFGFRPATGEWYAGLYTGSRFSFRLVETWESSVAWSNFQTGDFNGDGNTDVLAQAGSGYWYYLTLNAMLNGETTYAGRTTTAYAPNNAPIVDDFNGDGLSDLAVVNTRREVFVKLGTGSGLADPGFWGTAPANRSLVNTGDFNSDGRADLLHFTPNTGGWIALLGSESAFTPNAFGIWTGLPLSGFEEFEVGNFG